MQAFDIVISGAGMVGLALVCGLQGTRLRVAVIERQGPEAIPPVEQPAFAAACAGLGGHHRAAHQSLSGHESLGAGQLRAYRLRRCRAGPSRAGAYHIIENSVIQQALWRHAKQLAEVTLISPATLRQVAWDENEAFITLDDDRMLTARPHGNIAR